jgi:PPOX class probable F420-dependent enzyme
MTMTPAEVDVFLAGERRAHLATINPDGTPHVVPLSYVVIDGRVTFWTDPRSRKVANLRRDPRLTCLVEAGAQFAEFRAVELHGHAEVGADAETSRRTGLALYERAAGELTDDMRAAVDAMVAERVAVTVVPDRTVSWDHRKLAGVRPADVGR